MGRGDNWIMYTESQTKAKLKIDRKLKVDGIIIANIITIHIKVMTIKSLNVQVCVMGIANILKTA